MPKAKGAYGKVNLVWGNNRAIFADVIVYIFASLAYAICFLKFLNTERTQHNYLSPKISVRERKYSLKYEMLKTRNFTKNVWAH